MARTIVALTENVWTDLGTGAMVVTVHKQGSGALLLNNSQTDASSIVVPQGRMGDQFANNVTGDTVSAKPSGVGWEVAVDGV